MMTPSPSLPQDCDESEREARAHQLEDARARYVWEHAHHYEYEDEAFVLEPIAKLRVDEEYPLPPSQGLDIVQVIALVEAATPVLSNMVEMLTNLHGAGAVERDPEPSEASGWFGARVGALFRRIGEDLEEIDEEIDEALEDAQIDAEIDVELLLDSLRRAKASAHVLESIATKERAKPGLFSAEIATKISNLVSEFLEEFFSEAFIGGLGESLAEAGLWGRASSLRAYADQFQAYVLPATHAAWNSDAEFARLRIAGPNPMVLARISAFPDKLKIDLGRFSALTGQNPRDALASGRVYLADYEALALLEPGSFPTQKYVSAPVAVFVLDEARANLSPVAIQCGQVTSAATPLIYVDEGEAWSLAKIHVSVADGNYHELVSHFGLTHLLTERVAVSTQRQLATTHPLHLLLNPHFQGTMFINATAVLALINPGGIIDRLLGGTIESDWKVAATALLELDFNARMLPAELATRGVDDIELLPSYPYRDDGLLIWGALADWARDYLSLYYTSDAEVVADTELQAWFDELVAEDAGGVRGLGERGPAGERGLFSLDYLVEVTTMIIFTASAQHAAVNFQQADVMGYTPAMPLAAYAPPPSDTPAPFAGSAQLELLPPLEQALLQHSVGMLLGGVYFTRLGDYDRHEADRYFGDPRVGPALEQLRSRLEAVEATIATRNLGRPSYTSLLPSRIPQSTNI